jgi:hypothetical protein
MKGRIGGVLAVAAVFAVAAAAVSPGNGNSAGGLCRRNGWTSFLRVDDSSSARAGGCLSYGAQGGMMLGKIQSQLDCEGTGGTFSIDPETDLTATGNVGFLWSCNGVQLRPETTALSTLAHDCFADGGLALISLESPASSCFRL